MPRPKSKDLALINLRLRTADIEAARQRATALGVPYQHVIRAWVADGAAISGRPASRSTSTRR